MMLVASQKGIYFGYGVPLSGPTPASGVAVVPVSDPGATVDVRIVSRKDIPPVVQRFRCCACRVFGVPEHVGARRIS